MENILLRILNLAMFLAVPTLIGFVCSKLARPNGRNPKGWFFLGFVAGAFGFVPIAIPEFGAAGYVIAGALFIAPIVAVKLLPPVTGTGALKACPHCAETVKAEALVCKHCGREIG